MSTQENPSNPFPGFYGNTVSFDDELGVDSRPSSRQIGGTHYKDLPIQPALFSEENKLSFLEGCVVKRVCRWRRGGKGVEDLLKARHEIDLLIEMNDRTLATQPAKEDSDSK